jgi:hypothetical protein
MLQRKWSLNMPGLEFLHLPALGSFLRRQLVLQCSNWPFFRGGRRDINPSFIEDILLTALIP